MEKSVSIEELWELPRESLLWLPHHSLARGESNIVIYVLL